MVFAQSVCYAQERLVLKASPSLGRHPLTTFPPTSQTLFVRANKLVVYLGLFRASLLSIMGVTLSILISHESPFLTLNAAQRI